MLTELIVENLGVIERAELSLGPGCSALTGETGAGKTLVVAAVGLLLGERADRTLIREGASRAVVEGRCVIAPDHDIVELLNELDLAGDGGRDVEVVLHRSIDSDGRSRARVNGRMLPSTTLARIGGALIEIAGQSEHHHLTRPPVQRALLDGYAGPAALDLAGEVAGAVKRAASLRHRLDELLEGRRTRRRELDALVAEISEIEGAGLRPGEASELAAEAARLEHAEAIAAGLDAAAERLSGESGAEEQVASAAKELSRLVELDADLAPSVARLDSAAAELLDVASELHRRVVTPDAGRLSAVRGRLATISSLQRKYGDDEADVLSYLEAARARFQTLSEDEEGMEDLEEAVAAADARAIDLAGRLSEVRAAAATSLASEVQGRLSELALEGARIEIRLEPTELYEGGAEKVAILAAMNPGDGPKPLAKVASGGELSRTALALRLLMRSGSARTMIFDEVDAGVGGAAARAVGRALADLARASGIQTIVVTHLPQVAAFADDHYVVSKDAGGERSTSQVTKVEGEERVEELSRMLSGLPESDRAQEHARELLDMAGPR